jgi:hypothetical protein
MTDPMSPAPQPPALAPQVLHCPTLKYTVVNEQPCAVCGEPLRSGDLCYRNSAENPDEWRHLSHGPPAPVASSPAHRICFVGTCGKPDVNAPDEGTWPTCSKYPPACVDHLAFVPPPQRKGVASSPAASGEALRALVNAGNKLYTELWDTYGMTPRVQPLLVQWEESREAALAPSGEKEK